MPMYTNILCNLIILAFYRLLFGVNEKLLTQHISGLVTKYKQLDVSNQAWARVRARAKG